MRTILKGESVLRGVELAPASSVIEVLIESAEDWEIMRGPGFATADLRAHFAEVERLCAKRELPVRASDPLLAKVTSHEDYARRADFALAAANAFVIMAQISAADRQWTDGATQLLLIVHHHYRAYGLAFSYGGAGKNWEVRTRCDSRLDLERATESIATALTSRSPFHWITTSTGGLGQQRADGEVRTTFQPVLMKEPLHEPVVAEGKVTELSSGWQIAVRAFLSVAPRTLALIGFIFTAASAALYVVSGGDHNAYEFMDGVFGRLATAAFGAALIAGTERTLDLRRRLRKSEGKARYAALIEWSP